LAKREIKIVGVGKVVGAGERLTNKAIISELFPILKKATSNVPPLTEKDYYGNPRKEVIIDNHRVIYTEFEKGYVVVSVVKPLSGRYDHATVSAIIRDGKVAGYEYAKEFRGLGNGFYAELDENGRIIKSEWD
jgi:hypothetical protein